MVLIDHDGFIKTYTKVNDVLKEFFNTRMTYYLSYKDYLEGKLSAESLKINTAHFLKEIVDGTLKFVNMCREDIIKFLESHKYDSDPRNPLQADLEQDQG